MKTATMTSKGQVTIPIEVRRDMRLETGSKISFVPMGDGLYRIVPVRGSVMDLADYFDSQGIHATIEDMNLAIAEAATERYKRSTEVEQ
jgi:AbrB family looped-hinge helix DNA binding protein